MVNSNFQTGTSRDEMAVYTEKGEEYEANMLRLMRKWDTIKEYVPAPEVLLCGRKTDMGVLYFGTSESSDIRILNQESRPGSSRGRRDPVRPDRAPRRRDHERP